MEIPKSARHESDIPQPNRKVRFCAFEVSANRVRSEPQQPPMANPRQQQAIILATNLMVSTGEIYSRMGYPLRQGYCLLKLLDQSIFNLQLVGTDRLRIDHRLLLKELFNEQHSDLVTCRSEKSAGEIPSFREWKTTECIALLKRSKQCLMLEQIAFLIDRIRLAAFVGEVRSNRYFTSVNLGKVVSWRQTKFVQAVNGDGSRLKSRTDVAGRLLGSSGNMIGLRQLDSKKELGLGFLRPPTNTANRKILDHNQYRLLWDATFKEYRQVLLTQSMGNITADTNFLGRLNNRIKRIKQTKEDTTLPQSLVENVVVVILHVVTVIIGVLLSLFVESTLAVMVCLALCCGYLLSLLLRVLLQQPYSETNFRNSIKRELAVYHERNKSDSVYEMSASGYDINVIRKKD